MESAHFAMQDLLETRAQSGAAWHEFLRVAALSAGVYVLEAGAEDPQAPHSEDEVYVVMQGQARLRVGAEEYRAHAGDILYVAAHAPHRFVEIREQLVVLVLFAPAEYAQAGGSA
ncbi:MAG: cupin domain-containing protein [Caldilineaceae bacterium]